MGRTPGAKNKTNNKNILIVENKERKYTDSEDIFLTDALEKYKFWKARAMELKNDGKDSSREEEYAEAYRILLNRFSVVDKVK